MPPAKGTLVHDRIASRALRGNPLGDPHERDVFIYLPPGYDATAARFPVVLMLPGFTGIGADPWQPRAWQEPLHERMDRLIGKGACPPMIVATPDCFTSIGGSQYLDSPAIGSYETFVVREVVPWIDGRYRTLAARDHRGVCGKSSGGYGALMLAMRNPRVFGALASHAGDAYFDYCYVYDFVKCWDAMRGAGGVEPWFEAFHKKVKKSGSDIAVLNILAMAAAYSPDERSPWGFELPFQLETGEIREDVMRRWRRMDPVHACRRHAKALRGMRGIYLDCGLRDEYALHAGTRILAERLRELGVAHVHEEFDDGHGGIWYRYDRSLPFLGNALAPAEAPAARTRATQARRSARPASPARQRQRPG